MDRDGNAIAAAREYADAAWLATQDDDESLQERIDDRAAKISAELVASPERLAEYICRGHVCLYDVTMQHEGETVTAEHAIGRIIAYSMSDARFGLQSVGKAIAEYLAESLDVREKAEVEIAAEIDAEDHDYAA